jgi:hypothetical protein
MRQIIEEPRMKVNTIMGCTKRVSPKRIHSTFPDSDGEKTSAYLGDLAR